MIILVAYEGLKTSGTVYKQMYWTPPAEEANIELALREDPFIKDLKSQRFLKRGELSSLHVYYKGVLEIPRGVLPNRWIDISEEEMSTIKGDPQRTELALRDSIPELKAEIENLRLQVNALLEELNRKN